MNILITGAAGFMGRHFARHHVYLDHHVVAVDDFSSPYADWPSDLGHITVEDAAEFVSRRIIHATYDIVYWFAAPVGGREKIEGDPLFNADSLRLDTALFRWAVRTKPKVIVYPSSSAVYGVRAQQADRWAFLDEGFFDPSDKDSWPVPDEMYGFTKLAGEVLAWKAARYGVNTLCIRPFSGYGEDQSLEYPVPSIVSRVRDKEDPLIVWGPGTQTRDFIHIDDVVGATIARLKGGIEGHVAMNIGWGFPLSFNELAKMAAALNGYEPKIVNMPDKPFGVMHRVCDPKQMSLYYPEPKVPLLTGLARMLGVEAVHA